MMVHFSHIGIVVRDLERSLQIWVEVLGLVEVHRSVIEGEGVRTALLRPIGGTGQASVELMEPIDKNDLSNPIARYLQQAGEGFYHLALIDEDVAAKSRTLASRGATMLERPAAETGFGLAGRVSAHATRYLVHPKFANGVLIELLQKAD